MLPTKPNLSIYFNTLCHYFDYVLVLQSFRWLEQGRFTSHEVTFRGANATTHQS